MVAQPVRAWPSNNLEVQPAVAASSASRGSHAWVLAEPLLGYPPGTQVNLPRHSVVMTAAGSPDAPRSALVSVEKSVVRVCEVPVDSLVEWGCERSSWLQHACQEWVSSAMDSPQESFSSAATYGQAAATRTLNSAPPLMFSMAEKYIQPPCLARPGKRASPTSPNPFARATADACMPSAEGKNKSGHSRSPPPKKAVSLELPRELQRGTAPPLTKPTRPRSADSLRGIRRLSQRDTSDGEEDLMHDNEVSMERSLTEEFVKAVAPIEEDDPAYPLRRDRTPQIIQELRAAEGDSSPASPAAFSTWRSDTRPYVPRADFLHTIASPCTSLFRYAAAVVAEVMHNLHAERCSVYFVDEIRKELWCVGSLDMESFSMSIDKGIAGCVARSGEMLNVEDVHSHDAFDSTVETLTGYVVKTMLCAPIKHMVDDKRTIGVIQVLNKLGKQRARFFEQDAVFSQQDCADLLKISVLIGDSFHRQRWKAFETGPSRGDREVLSMIASYSEQNCDEEPPERQSSSPTIRARLTCTGVEDRVADPSKPLDVYNSPDANLRSLNFNVLSHSPEELIQLVPVMMQHTGCVDSCLIPPETLRNWSRGARVQYRDNPFHSWFHAFGVFQNCYYQLYASNMHENFRFLDVFALLIAALCHDLDHPGYNNNYLIDSQSELALRYNDVSVLENHHAALACELLRGESTRIAAGLDVASQKALRRSVIRCILDTDMSHHSSLCQKLNQLRPEDASGEDRELLLSACIHTADLSAQTQGWDLASQWEERIAQEFSNQAHAEREAGRQPAPFMQFQMDDLKQRGKLQRDFIDFVLVPLWGPYTDLMSDLRHCYDNLVHNRGLHDHRAVHGNDSES